MNKKEKLNSISKSLDSFIVQEQQKTVQQIEKERQQRFTIGNYDEPVFLASSLEDWLNIIVKYNTHIPYVPAEKVFEEKVVNLLGIDEDDESLDKDFINRLTQINNHISNNNSDMLRWDSCSSADIKFHMGNEDDTEHCLSNINNEEKQLHILDMRFFDMLYTYPRANMSAFKRPIIKPLMFDNYPVEFRVYVHNGKVKGISHYYPQTELPYNTENEKLMLEAKKYTDILIKTCQDNNTYPVMPNSERSINFTADFIVDTQGKVIFLEAGPGFGYGAHPCCFYDPKNNPETIKIKGLALSNDHSKKNSIIDVDWLD